MFLICEETGGEASQSAIKAEHSARLEKGKHVKSSITELYIPKFNPLVQQYPKNEDIVNNQKYGSPIGSTSSLTNLTFINHSGK